MKKKNSKLFINYFKDREQFKKNGTKKLFTVRNLLKFECVSWLCTNT